MAKCSSCNAAGRGSPSTLDHMARLSVRYELCQLVARMTHQYSIKHRIHWIISNKGGYTNGSSDHKVVMERVLQREYGEHVDIIMEV